MLDYGKSKGIKKKKMTSASLTMLKALTVWITTNWNILNETGIPDHITCLLRNLYAQQEAVIKMDMEQWTDSKLGKEYIKSTKSTSRLSPYLLNLYAEYIM